MLATNFVWRIVNWPGFWPLLTVVISFLAVVASLLAAWIGGHIAGNFALLAQEQAARDQRERDRQAERQALLAILQAIQAELETLKSDCLDPLQERLNNSPPGLHATTPVLQNRCSVFEFNAAALGKIDNPELLKKIVSVYGQIKGLLDHMNFNYQRVVANTDLLRIRANNDFLRAHHRDLQIQAPAGQAPLPTAVVEPPEVQAAITELTEIRENMEQGLAALLQA